MVLHEILELSNVHGVPVRPGIHGIVYLVSHAKSPDVSVDIFHAPVY